MYKKITQFIICVLSVVMLMQSLPVFAAEQKDDLQKTSTLLNALDISLGNREFTQDTKITRAEAAIILLKFMNIPVMGTNQAYYTDVNNSTFGKNEIIYAADLGLSNGYGDGTYRPEQFITYQEALVMTIRALGYGKIMNNENDAKSVISKIGLTTGIRGISYEDPVPYAVMQAILYNALSCDVAELKSDSNSGGNEYVFEKTALEQYFDVHRRSGVVTATDITALAGYAEAGQNMIRINDEEYYANSGSLSEYLGQSVEVYYRKDDNGDNTILYVYNTKSEVKSFKEEDIQSFSGMQYKIEENNRTKNYKLAANYSLIYNSKFLDDHSEKYMIPQNGSLTLVDTTGDGSYDVVFVYDYKTACVSKVDTDGKHIYDKIYHTSFDYDVANLKVYDSNGYMLTTDDIKTDSVLLIAESIDKDSMIIRVSDKIVTGNVERVSSDNKVRIDGTEYKVSDVFPDTENANFNTGASASFRLDVFDKIVCCVTGDSADEGQFYYLLRASIDDESVEEQLIVKLLNSDNERKSFVAADIVKIDSKGYKKASDALAALQKTLDDGSKVTRRAPVMVKFNEDNQVTSIDLPYENGQPGAGEADNSLHKYASFFDDPIVGVQTNSDTNVLSGRILYNPSSTIVFLVPADGNIDSAADTDFRAALFNKQYAEMTFMKCDAYTTKYPELYAEVLVSRATDPVAMADRGGTYLVTEIAEALNDDGEAGTRFDIVKGKNAYSYFVEESVDISKWNVSAGDVVRLATNTKDEITDLVVYYDASEDKVENDDYAVNIQPNYIHASTQSIVGGVYDANGGYIRIFPGNVTPDRNTDFLIAAQHLYDYYGGDICHRSNKTIEPVDFSKIKTYKEAGENYTKAVFISEIGQPRYVYFYD